MKHLEYLEVWEGVFSVTHSKVLGARNQERHRKMPSKNNQNRKEIKAYYVIINIKT